MTGLREAVKAYVTLRRGLGYKLEGPASTLRSFVRFAEAEGATHVTTELALRFAKLPSGAQSATWAARLGRVRRFAAWHAATEPRTEIPPDGLLVGRYRRKAPYIYRDEEVRDLIRAAEGLPTHHGLRGPTCATLIGLLSVTGIRMSEGLALDRGDVDLERGVLAVHRAKFGKSRLVPLHASSVGALVNYARLRDRVFPKAVSPAFFLSDRGRRITKWALRYNFAKVSREIGLRTPAGGYRHGKGPRLHDLRHRFAARTLLDWYRAGLDVEREIPKLATYLGHVHVNETYWYLEAIPELLALAAERVREQQP